jgi:hypothetical protein
MVRCPILDQLANLNSRNSPVKQLAFHYLGKHRQGSKIAATKLRLINNQVKRADI